MRFRSDSPCSRLSSAFPGRSLNSEREVNVSKSSLAIVVMRASSCEVYEIQNAERIEFYKKNCGTCSPFRVHNPHRGPFREELGSGPFETSQLTQQTLSNLISNANPFSNLFKAFSKEEKSLIGCILECTLPLWPVLTIDLWLSNAWHPLTIYCLRSFAGHLLSIYFWPSTFDLLLTIFYWPFSGFRASL